MSNSPLNAPHSPPHAASPSPNPADLFALAETLQETAEAVLAVCRTSTQAHAAPSGDIGLSAPEGEARHYYFSLSVLRHERELLQKYRAEGFPDLIAEVHILLAGLVKVMKSIHPDARLKGYAVFQPWEPA